MGSVFVLNGHSKQGLVAIRSLGEKGLKVTVGSSRRWNAGRFSKHADRYVTYPSPENDLCGFLRAVENELERREYDMLLPVEESTVDAVVKHRSRFEEYTNIPFLPYEKLAVGLNKRKTIETARNFDVPHPNTVLPGEESLDTLGESLGYPIVVKPIRGNGRDGVSVCDSYGELERVVRETRKEYGPVLFQEFIPNGGERGVYSFFNRDGDLARVTVQQRLRSSPPEGGASTYRETIEDPELVAISNDFLTQLGWQGVAMTEFRIDSRTDEPLLLEINPRLWGSLSLSVYAGVDFPYYMYQLSVGDHVEPRLEYKTDVQARNLFTDLLQVLQREDRFCALREYLTTPTKPCRFDIVRLNDPLPIVGQIMYSYQAMLDSLRNRNHV